MAALENSTFHGSSSQSLAFALVCLPPFSSPLASPSSPPLGLFLSLPRSGSDEEGFRDKGNDGEEDVEKLIDRAINASIVLAAGRFAVTKLLTIDHEYWHIVQMQVTLEDRVIVASTLMDAERFSIKTVTGEDIAEESRSNGSNKMKVGNKRKHNSSEVVGDIDNSGKDPTWRVNFDEFKRLSRKKACVESAKTSHDDEAGVVLSAFLEASKAMGNTVVVMYIRLSSLHIHKNQISLQ